MESCHAAVFVAHVDAEGDPVSMALVLPLREAPFGKMYAVYNVRRKNERVTTEEERHTMECCAMA